MSKIATAVLGALLLIMAVASAGASSALPVFSGDGSRWSRTALKDIPTSYRVLYEEAAKTCPGLDQTVLAAVGKVETDHGRSDLPGVRSGANHAGAMGPMQFLQPTFDSVTAKHPVPGKKGTPSPYKRRDAIYTAAAYLCDSGARNNRDLRGAIYAYNHADWYVAKVLAQAKRYRDTAPSSDGAAMKNAGLAAQEAINYARGQIGLPYVWGGNGPDHGHAGFDCSGLTKAAYAAAGVTLPRTAEEQYRAGPRVPKGERLLPGDLVFYATPSGYVDHVGLYIGDGQMINAPNFGKKIRIEPHRYDGDGYAGATRPAAADWETGQAGAGGL